MSVYDYYDIYLKADDLRGESHAVKVERVAVKEFPNPRTFKQEKKIVLKFERRRPLMILNSTQAAAIMKIAGTDDERKWCAVEFVITAGRAVNGKNTIVVTTRAGNDDVDIAFPKAVDGGRLVVGSPSVAPSTVKRQTEAEKKITRALDALEKKGLPNAAPVTWWVARDERAVAWAAGIWGVTKNVALLRIDEALKMEAVSESLPEQEFKEWVDAVKV